MSEAPAETNTRCASCGGPSGEFPRLFIGTGALQCGECAHADRLTHLYAGKPVEVLRQMQVEDGRSEVAYW